MVGGFKGDGMDIPLQPASCGEGTKREKENCKLMVTRMQMYESGSQEIATITWTQ